MGPLTTVFLSTDIFHFFREDGVGSSCSKHYARHQGDSHEHNNVSTGREKRKPLSSALSKQYAFTQPCPHSSRPEGIPRAPAPPPFLPETPIELIPTYSSSLLTSAEEAL